MPDAAAWEMFGALLGVLAVLGGAVMSLRRLGILSGGRPAPAPAAPPDGVGQELDDIRREMRVSIAKIHSRLDGISTAVAQDHGELQEIKRTNRLILEHLLRQDRERP